MDIESKVVITFDSFFAHFINFSSCTSAIPKYIELSAKEYQHLVQKKARETDAKRDGTGKNLIVPRCPFCGKSGGKFGIYIVHCG